MITETAIARELEQHADICLDRRNVAINRIRQREAIKAQRGLSRFSRAVDPLEADHAVHKAAVYAVGDKLDDIAVRLRAINPKLFDAVRGEG